MYLNCHTYYSFQYGTLSVRQLVEEAHRCGVSKLALTEINNTASYIELLRTKGSLNVAAGVEFRNEAVPHEMLYVVLARNNRGFEHINRFLSRHLATGKPFPQRAPELPDTFTIYPFGKCEPELLRENEFIGIRLHQLSRYARLASRQTAPDKFVLLHPVTFASRHDHAVHRLLRAMHYNTILSKLSAEQHARADEIMLPVSELKQRLQHFPELVRNTERVLDACSLSFALGEDKNKRCVTGSEASDWDLLITRAWEGFQQRYDAANSALRERFQHELNIIRQKQFCAYYLIAHDLIEFARSRNFEYVGRGSGANSMVAYCLGITNVDPIELDLYFERFLNPERSSPPDFDIDFSWDHRDEVYNYLFQRYGSDHVCLLGTHVTYQERSVLRELGKVFGLPKHEINALVEEPERNRHNDHITELIGRYADIIRNFPSNISIHAGGVLITEQPIYAFTATTVPPKGLPVSHFDMHSAEDMGIYKFDILSQRGLGHIRESIQLIRQNKGVAVNINRFAEFKQDEKIRQLLRTGQTMGCFYVESPAMRMLLAKLQCEDYLTLVAASSIIRPGVARSGMMRAYIERFHAVRNGKSYQSIHPKMDELLRETYGVMVYQEDVIKVAHYFAGLTLAEADVLRRGMSGKYRSREEFQRIKDKFMDNCRKRGYDEAVIERVWYEIESFSGYSFAKGHSASYAVESYQSLYLKAHYPLEFMVGVINNFGGFYRTEFYVHEARRLGARIEAPCVNNSRYRTTITGNTIYLGFIHLKGLETRLAQRIAEERAQNGPFISLSNFMRRLNATLEQVRILIRIGAFRFTGKTKQQLLWEAMLYVSQAHARTPAASLFDTEPKTFPLPALERNELEDAFDEIELLGFPLCNPFKLVSGTEATHRAGDIRSHLGKTVCLPGYVVTVKNTYTIKGEGMYFGTFYDEEGEVFDTVHFPDVARKYPFRGRGFYRITGKVTEDFGVYVIEVKTMEKIPMISKRAETHFVEDMPFAPADSIA
ncbi:MAG: DNA polymerase III subunit alpha [Cyclobacteriaceae bacterium]|nr:DNA polymerase III subunit alpha [Cyclobacteriaceae bacterium]MDW8332292.1 DNA polymerase III subunit alpha [Cyclobacteriaceae bacterium]